MRKGMQKIRRQTAVFCLAILLSLSTASTGFATEADVISEEELTAEEGEEELTEEELEQLMQRYMTQMGLSQEGTLEDQLDEAALDAQKITEPPLRLSKEAGGNIRYTLPNGSFFIVNVPEGMITSQPVEFSVSQGIAGVVQYQDDLDRLPENWHFDQKGSYRVKFLSYQPPSGGVGDYYAYEVNFHFTIIGQSDGSLGAMPAPEGFRISDVWLDGQKLNLEQDRCFFFRDDGRYAFRFIDEAGQNIQVETAFQRDTSAPFLTFSKELSDGQAEGPLEFYPSEPGCKVFVGYNGEYGYTGEYVLSAPGSYELTVEDQVGNKRIYHVGVRQVFRILDIRMIAAGAVLLLLGAIRLIFLRQNMKVV